MTDLEPDDVWDEFDHVVRTRHRGALHLPTPESTIDDPAKRCNVGSPVEYLRGIAVEGVHQEPEEVCSYCLADVNGCRDQCHANGDGQATRERMADLIESMGGTPP